MTALLFFSLWINAGNIMIAYINVTHQDVSPENMPDQPWYIEVPEMVITFPAIMIAIAIEKIV